MAGGGAGGDINFQLQGDASGANDAIEQVHGGLEGIAQFAEGMFIGEAMIASLEAVIELLQEIPAMLVEINAAAETTVTILGAAMSDQAIASGQTIAATSDQIATATATTQDAVVTAQTNMSRAVEAHTYAQGQLAAKMSGGAGSVSHAAEQVANAVDQMNTQIAQATAQATVSMEAMQDSFDLSMTSINDQAAKTAESITTSFANAMDALTTRHDQAVQNFQDQENTLTENFNQAMADRQKTFELAMSALTDAHTKTVQTIQDQIAKLDETYALSAAKQQAAFAGALDKAPDTYEAQRQSAASNALALQKDLVDAQASGDGALVAALQARIAEENGIHNESYSAYLANLKATQAATKAAADQVHADALAALNQRLADEAAHYQQSSDLLTSKYASDIAKLRNNYAEQMDALRAREAQEMATFTKAVADKTKAEQEALAKSVKDQQDRIDKLKAKYAEDVANFQAAEDVKVAAFKAAEVKRIAAIQQAEADRVAHAAGRGQTPAQKAQADLLYQQHIKDLQDKLDDALRKQAAAELAYQRSRVVFNQLPQELANLSGQTDPTGATRIYGVQNLASDKARADSLYNFIEDKAKNLPFAIPAMEETGKKLQIFRMDATTWLDTIGDTAAATGKPMDQITQALGRFSQPGGASMAMRQFRSMGVDLQQVPGLEFSGTGLAAKMTTPIGEAMGIVQKYLNERFGGTAVEMANTWDGQVQKMKNTLEVLALAIGKPMFNVLKEDLNKLGVWISSNQPAIDKFATVLGTTLGDAIQKLGPWLTEALNKMTAWLGPCGGYTTDLQHFGEALNGVVNFVISAVKWFGDAFDTLESLKTTILAVTIGVIAFNVALAVLSIVSGIVTVIGTLVTVIGTLSTALGIAQTAVYVFMTVGLGPLGLAIAAVGLILGVLVLAWNGNWFGMRDTVLAVWNDISIWVPKAFQDVSDYLGGTMATLEIFFRNAWVSIATPAITAFNQVGAFIADTFKGVVTIVASAVNFVIDAINGLISTVVSAYNTVQSLIPGGGNPVSKSPVLPHVDAVGIMQGLLWLTPIGPAMAILNAINNQATSPWSSMAPGGTASPGGFDYTKMAAANAANPPVIVLNGQAVSDQIRPYLIRTGLRNVNPLGP